MAGIGIASAPISGGEWCAYLGQAEKTLLVAKQGTINTEVQ